MHHHFAEFVLDSGNFRLRRDGIDVPIEPQVFDLLQFLVERAGTVVTREVLLARVWKGRIVSDAAIAGTVKAARRALGDDGARQAFIRTVHGRGYAFVAAVTPGPEAATAASPPTAGAGGGNAPTAAQGAAERLSAPVSSAAHTPSVAVLPFVPLQGTPSLAVIGDALAQEVILELSRLHWLGVIARGSSFQFRGHDADVARIGEILGARYIVTGTLVREADRCSVTVELCNAADRRVVVSQRFETPLATIMHLRNVIAGEIVGALETRVQQSEALTASSIATEQLDAWSAYHRGLWHMFRFDARNNDTAAQLFALALQRENGFARAHAALSFTHFQNAFLGFSADTAGEQAAAHAHAERAFELDALDPFVNLTMGRAEWLNGRIDAAMPWLQQAIDLNPNYALALYNRALLGALQGGDGQGGGTHSERDIVRAMELSPIDPLHHAMLATRALDQLLQGNTHAAAAWARRATLQPGAHVQIRAIAAIVQELAGERARAREGAERIRRANPDYRAASFFRFFPVRDAVARGTMASALKRLGL